MANYTDQQQQILSLMNAFLTEAETEDFTGFEATALEALIISIEQGVDSSITNLIKFVESGEQSEEFKELIFSHYVATQYMLTTVFEFKGILTAINFGDKYEYTTLPELKQALFDKAKELKSFIVANSIHTAELGFQIINFKENITEANISSLSQDYNPLRDNKNVEKDLDEFSEDVNW